MNSDCKETPPDRLRFIHRNDVYWIWGLGVIFTMSGLWFASSTSFANPAITIARSLSDTFAGIAPHDVPLFVIAQLLGAAMAAIAGKLLFEAG
jgi:glycerol uptake facilitator-like aquaporin